MPLEDPNLFFSNTYPCSTIFTNPCLICQGKRTLVDTKDMCDILLETRNLSQMKSKPEIYQEGSIRKRKSTQKNSTKSQSSSKSWVYSVISSLVCSGKRKLVEVKGVIF